MPSKIHKIRAVSFANHLSIERSQNMKFVLDRFCFPSWISSSFPFSIKNLYLYVDMGCRSHYRPSLHQAIFASMGLSSRWTFNHQSKFSLWYPYEFLLDMCCPWIFWGFRDLVAGVVFAHEVWFVKCFGILLQILVDSARVHKW